MQARFVHRCTHVLDKDKTAEFYKKALGFEVVRVSGPEDGSWSNTFMAIPGCPFEIELTWNNGYTGPYDNGGMDTHIAFEVDDFDAFHALHQEMGCIQKENPSMGIYFILDPDGQRIEIIPKR